MLLRDKNAYFLILILSVLAFFPLAMPASFSVDQTLDPRLQAIPLRIGNWTGQNVELDERTYEILETRNILSRVYEHSNKGTVHLVLVGSNKDRRVAHPPEVCYTSSHYNIINSNEGSVEIFGKQIPVKEFVAQDQRNPEHKEQVLYVYKVGKRFTTNYYSQQLQFASDRLTRKETQILLIRVSSPSSKLFQEFLTEIFPLLE